MTAQNLLYLADPKSTLEGTKGTAEYDAIIDRLEKTDYAHQQKKSNQTE
jgi:hypothetical protein